MDYQEEIGLINQMVYQQSDQDTFDYFKKRLVDASKESDVILRGLFCHALGSIAYKVGLYGRAIDYYFNSLDCYQSVDNTVPYREELISWETIEIAFAHCYVNQTKLSRDFLVKEPVQKSVIKNKRMQHHLLLLEGVLAYKEDKPALFVSKVQTLLELPLNPSTILRDFNEFILLFRYSISLEEYEISIKILDILTSIVTQSNRIDSQCQLAECKVLYYKSTNDIISYKNTFLELISLTNLKEKEYKKMKDKNIYLKDIIFHQYEQKVKTNKRIAKLKAIAEVDSLTKLPNRYRINQYGPSHFLKARKEQKSLGVLMLDIDNFKLYNDQFGHLIGDKYLSLLGIILQKYSDTAFAARLSGDEFLVIFYDQTNEQIKEYCQNISTDLKNCDQIIADVLPFGTLTISQGVVNEIPNYDMTWEDYVRRADYALYKGKKSNKNQITFVNVLP
ncbi:GGDEF domain-containing protein [Lachnoclostridium phytofermentans]|uniref:Diguanylate cyclase n=1 Tax=Lachnoclostridium phytofermentans (strain ATCC 700394 / DSM 18823 / ISDg) TaxID=357809 RepID=A9KML5_LACP7|nr:GGDEF domain-containing protein [Lachnoclostridium phytofermentans]ABX41460.1 diguanylate cyclase [Lachnoclostridium phytofermentans ISDg]